MKSISETSSDGNDNSPYLTQSSSNSELLGLIGFARNVINKFTNS